MSSVSLPTPTMNMMNMSNMILSTPTMNMMNTMNMSNMILSTPTMNMMNTMNMSNMNLSTPTIPRRRRRRRGVPEPGPKWQIARIKWGFFWELHWIGFGFLFVFLAFNSVLALIKHRQIPSLARKLQFQAINGLLILLGVSRALYLWIDPYESGENVTRCPLWLIRPLFGIAFPCLTSAFCLLHMAFLEAVKLQLGSQLLENVCFIFGMIALHFAVVIVSDTTVAFHADRTELLIVCQSFFIVWGALNAAAFMYSGSKIILRDRENQKQLDATASGKTSSRGGKIWSSKVGKVTIANSVLAVACIVLQTYSLFGVYGIYFRVVRPQPWPWWYFQTCFRFVELGMAYLIAYTVLQPAANRRNGIFDLYGCLKQKNRVTQVLAESVSTDNADNTATVTVTEN